MKRFWTRMSLTAALVVSGLQLVTAAPASAAALTNVQWSVSLAHPSQADSRYSWSFTTATTGTIAYVTMSVPATTAAPGGLTVVDNYGISVGTAALAANTVTYTVTTPASIASGTPILITIDGFTNRNTAGSSTSTVTTQDNVPATIDGGTASNAVTFATNTTALTVVVARTITFTNPVTSVTMLMDPGLAALKDQTSDDSLTIATNAGSGYTLDAKASTLSDGGSFSISPVTADVSTGVASGAFTVNRWGFTIGNPTNGGGGTITLAGQLASNEYVGHKTTNQTIVTQDGPTNGDTIPITTRTKIDYEQAAASYSSTITYTATPSY